MAVKRKWYLSIGSDNEQKNPLNILFICMHFLCSLQSIRHYFAAFFNLKKNNGHEMIVEFEAIYRERKKHTSNGVETFSMALLVLLALPILLAIITRACVQFYEVHSIYSGKIINVKHYEAHAPCTLCYLFVGAALINSHETNGTSCGMLFFLNSFLDQCAQIKFAIMIWSCAQPVFSNSPCLTYMKMTCVAYIDSLNNEPRQSTIDRNLS